jgi:DnaK suppressor protein
MLSPEQTEQLRVSLESNRRRLVEKAHDSLGLTMQRDRGAFGRDSMDESTEEAMISTELRLADRETFLLTKVEAALVRLNDGVIDECEDCDEPIGFKRLAARPVTTLCIECKEDREENE